MNTPVQVRGQPRRSRTEADGKAPDDGRDVPRVVRIRRRARRAARTADPGVTAAVLHGASTAALLLRDIQSASRPTQQTLLLVVHRPLCEAPIGNAAATAVTPAAVTPPVDAPVSARCPSRSISPLGTMSHL